MNWSELYYAARESVIWSGDEAASRECAASRRATSASARLPSSTLSRTWNAIQNQEITSVTGSRFCI